MTDILIRNAIGFLVQTAPYAVLCLAPFTNRLRRPLPRVARRIAAAIACGLPIFLLFAVNPFVGAEARLILLNVPFLAEVGCLFAIFSREVDAPGSHKAFVLSIVATLGYFITQNATVIDAALGLSTDVEYMYPTGPLVVLSATTLSICTLTLPFMTRIKDALASLDDDRVWRRMAALPVSLALCLFVTGWIPDNILPAQDIVYLIEVGLAVFAAFLMRWTLDTVRHASDQARAQAALAGAIEGHRCERERLLRELEQQHASNADLARALSKARRRLGEEGTSERGGEGVASPSGLREAPVVLATPNQAYSFLPNDLLYAESLNRTRIVHLATGDTFTIAMTLDRIVNALPAGLVAYCHRSVAVNLDHVRSASPEGVVLDSGETVPVSRRKYQEFVRMLKARGSRK